MAERSTDSPPFRDRTRRAGRPRALATAVESVTKPIFGKRGLADGSIVRHWEAIIGPAFAVFTAPEKLVFPTGARHGGTLYLRVASGGIATQLQHLEPLIVERVNGYFGYGAVARLHLKQGPVTPPAKAAGKDLPPLDRHEEAELAERLDMVKDDALRQVLESLGRSVAARAKKRRTGG
jgi:hypothetical protein